MSYGFLRRWSDAARSSIVGRASAPRLGSNLAVQPGCHVIDADGTLVGTVIRVEPDWLAVGRGLLHSRLYIPLSSLAEARAGLARLSVVVTPDETRRWSQKPRSL
jgi:hypothetical protein